MVFTQVYGKLKLVQSFHADIYCSFIQTCHNLGNNQDILSRQGNTIQSLKMMICQALKRWKGNFNSCYILKEINQQRLYYCIPNKRYSGRSKVIKIVEKSIVARNWGREETNTQKRRYLGKWIYLVWEYDVEWTSVWHYQNS